MPERKPYKLPLPRAGRRDGEFDAFCEDHELRFQRCSDCGTWPHIRVECGSFKWEWVRSWGKGKLFSWTTATQPMMPQFADSGPYSPAIVELEEGVRMVTWLVGVKPDELQLGMPLQVVFDDVTPEVTLPKSARLKHDPEVRFRGSGLRSKPGHQRRARVDFMKSPRRGSLCVVQGPGSIHTEHRRRVLPEAVAGSSRKATRKKRKRLSVRRNQIAEEYQSSRERRDTTSLPVSLAALRQIRERNGLIRRRMV